MPKSNDTLNRSFKKIAAVGLLSLASAGFIMQVQSDEAAKQPAEPTVEVSAPIAGSINVNSANADELANALDGVGLKRAKAIVAWREQNGQFKHVDDLLKVKGIGKKILAANTGKINL